MISKRIFYGLVLLALTALSACALQLRGPFAETRYPIAGLWVNEANEKDRIGFLWIERIYQPAADAPAYRFEHIRVVARKLAISDETLFFTKRSGDIRTSQEEVLLIQTKYISSSRNSNNAVDKEIWHASNFGPESIERTVQETYNFDVLQIEKNGDRLVGSTGNFRRVAAPGYESRSPVGVVWRSKKEIASIFILPVGKIGAGTKMQVPGSKVEFRINGIVGEYATAFATSGVLNPGDAVVLDGVKPDSKIPMTGTLTKEQILEKIKRGEPVSREDLIKALGENK